jgi:hypothetical protein
MLRPTISRLVCLGVKLHLGPNTRFLLLPHRFGFIDMGRLIRREEEYIVYSCFWSSPAQSFASPSPTGNMTIFYCLRLETPSTRRTRSLYLFPPGREWPHYNPSQRVPFSLSPTYRRARTIDFSCSFGTGYTENTSTNCPSPSPSPSHIATDNQSVSKSWCRAPSGAHDQIFFSFLYMKFSVLFNWGALSDERSGLLFLCHSPY